MDIIIPVQPIFVFFQFAEDKKTHQWKDKYINKMTIVKISELY